MEKLSRPQAPAIFRALFPGLIEWLESPWAGPPQFTAAQSFRVEEMARDNRYVIRAELPGLDPERDIEVTVEGRSLTIHAERRQEDSGPNRSEFRYGSLTRLVRLPAKVDATDVTARYERGVLEVSVPLQEVKPEAIRVAIEKQTEARTGTASRRPRVPGVDDRRPGGDVVQGPAPTMSPPWTSHRPTRSQSSTRWPARSPVLTSDS